MKIYAETIYITLSEEIQANINSNKWAGNFNQIKWNTLSQVADLISIILKEAYQNSKIIQLAFFKPNDSSVVVGIEIVIESSANNIQNIHQIIEAILLSIMLPNYEKNTDAFENLQNFDGNLQKIIAENSQLFLAEKGNQKITTPLLVSTSSSKIPLNGKFSEKPKIKPTVNEVVTFTGILDGIKISKSTVDFLNEDRQSKTAFYDKSKFFNQLHQQLGRDDLLNIKIEIRQNEKGVYEYYLIDLAPI